MLVNEAIEFRTRLQRVDSGSGEKILFTEGSMQMSRELGIEIVNGFFRSKLFLWFEYFFSILCRIRLLGDAGKKEKESNEGRFYSDCISIYFTLQFYKRSKVGSSMNFLNSASHWAPTAPSTTRWSQLKVTVNILATSNSFSELARAGTTF